MGLLDSLLGTPQRQQEYQDYVSRYQQQPGLLSQRLGGGGASSLGGLLGSALGVQNQTGNLA